MSHLPEWAQWLTALATPTLAIFGICVALLQWRLSRHKLKMDLFDKRYQVYLSAQQFISHVASDAKVDFNEIIKFGRNTKQGIFLFDKNVTNYLNQIDKKAMELLKIQSELGRAPEADRNTLWKNEDIALKWFYDQSTEINQYFHKTLDVKLP
jgi:hypothetical protein